MIVLNFDYLTTGKHKNINFKNNNIYLVKYMNLKSMNYRLNSNLSQQYVIKKMYILTFSRFCRFSTSPTSVISFKVRSIMADVPKCFSS